MLRHDRRNHLAVIACIKGFKVVLCSVRVDFKAPQRQRCAFHWHRLAPAHILHPRAHSLAAQHDQLPRSYI